VRATPADARCSTEALVLLARAVRRRALLEGAVSMTWQTPAATDLRFGFEITMYVSAR
jgi:coenzyme PQQ precursor peptide PqqA